MKYDESTGTARSEKSKVRFGAADIVIILLLLISVASVVIRSVSDSNVFSCKTDKCRLEFTASEIRYTTYDAIETDTDVYLGDELIGKLSSQPAYSPAVLHTTGDDGAPIDVHYPENTLIDISGIIECDLVSTDGGYVTPDGVHLAPGCTVTLRLRTVDLTVTVTKLAPSGTAK